MQADRWPLWTPVAFGCGCGVYFGLPREPMLLPLALGAAILALAAMLVRRWGRAAVLSAILLLAAFGAGGALAGKLQTMAMAGPICPPLAGVTVEGWVVDMASRGTTGPRLLIAPTYIRGVPNDLLPKRVRLTVKDGDVIGPGAAVRMTALLNPPPPPAAPGAFDFARSAYFQGVGGFSATPTPPTPWK